MSSLVFARRRDSIVRLIDTPGADQFYRHSTLRAGPVGLTLR